jgi:uncharacterized membrane protein
MMNLLDLLAILPVFAWLITELGAAPSRRLFFVFFLLSGAIQYYRQHKNPDSLLWKPVLAFLDRLSNSPALRMRAFWFGLFFTAIFPILRTFAGNHTIYDHGIYNQMMWSLGHGLGMTNTIEPTLKHSLIHFSPTLIAAWPISALFNYHPVGLVVTASLATWGGIYAWLKIVRHHPDLEDSIRGKLEAGVLILAFFFPSFWSNFKWSFHESHLAFLFLSWGYYFLIRESFVWANLLWILTGLSKEGYWLDMAFLQIALIWIWKKRHEKWISFSLAGLMFGAFLAYSHWVKVETAKLISLHPNWPINDYFYQYFGHFGVKSLPALLIHAVTHPIDFLSKWWPVSWETGSWSFPIMLLVTFGFALIPSLLSWRTNRYAITILAIIPSFAIIFLERSGKFHRFGAHYVTILWPTLFLVSLYGFKKEIFRIKNGLMYLAIITAMLGVGGDYYYDARMDLKKIQSRAPLFDQLKQIQPEDSVMAYQIAINLSHRRYIVERPYTFALPNPCPDWIFLLRTESASVLNQVSQSCKCGYDLNFQDSEFDLYRVHQGCAK